MMNPVLSAAEALERLKEGNRRFVSNTRLFPLVSPERLAELKGGQRPVAIVIGCSDSRAPAEIVFDQSLGDLFVIRVAGNVVAPSQVDSVEFAARRFGTRLVVVMGHTECGAVAATIEALGLPEGAPADMNSIVGRIRPAVEPLARTNVATDPVTFRHHAVRANVRASVNQLRRGSRVLEQLIREQDLVVVGAVYDLGSGVVEYLDEVPKTPKE